MDGYSPAQRGRQQAIGQSDSERATNGIGSILLDSDVLGSNGLSTTLWRFCRGLWLDAVVRTGGICYW